MIEKTYLSKHPFALPKYSNYGSYPTPSDYHQAGLRKITTEEYLRRDGVIKQLNKETVWLAGDTCYPIHKDDYGKYGACIIVGCVKEYKEIPAEEPWPKNDNPFIISVSPIENREHTINCTNNWIVKKNPHMMLRIC